MRILIVDDDKSKINNIEKVVRSNLKIDQICNKYSYQSGIKEILGNNYDLILLDMSMPTFDITSRDNGGQLKKMAGKDILRYMSRKKVTIPVIIITQYDVLGDKQIKLSDIMSEFQEKYKEFYLGTVYYDITIENWKSDLINLINKKINNGEQNENTNY